MIDRRLFQDLDLPLIGIVLSLAAIGLLGVYSATYRYGSGQFTSHLIRILLGLVVCLVVSSLNYHRLTDLAVPLYGLALLVLCVTLILGSEIKGSRSWLVLAGFRVQPSELAKPILILTLARYMGDLPSSYLRRNQILTLFGLLLLPVLLVVLQGDMGTALMYFPIAAGMMLVAGVRLRILVALVIVGVLVAPVAWFALEDYHKERILVTINPDLQPQGVGYQTRQSKIAIGSGGLVGKGFGEGLQSRLGFVPEIQTDFIYALLAEETGFLGAAGLLFLFLLLLMRVSHVAENAQDRVGLLIVTGVASLFFVHILTNLGTVLGLVPAVGVPLPFVSYGGSSALAMFASLGLALSVRRHRFVY